MGSPLQATWLSLDLQHRCAEQASCSLSPGVLHACLPIRSWQADGQGASERRPRRCFKYIWLWRACCTGVCSPMSLTCTQIPQGQADSPGTRLP